MSAREAKFDEKDPTTWPEVLVFSVGLCSASCCSATHDHEAIARAVNREAPTGIGSRWEVSDEVAFADGSPHPFQCPDDPGRKHYLLHC